MILSLFGSSFTFFPFFYYLRIIFCQSFFFGNVRSKQRKRVGDVCTSIWYVFVLFSILHTECHLEALHSSVPFPVRQIWPFVSSYEFEWQYVWLVFRCRKVRLVKSRKNGGVFVSTGMATVHFSPELLSGKPVTLLMMNASVRWAVSQLQQPLKPDSRRSLSTTTRGLQPRPVLQCNKSMAVSQHSCQRRLWPRLPTQKKSSTQLYVR